MQYKIFKHMFCGALITLCSMVSAEATDSGLHETQSGSQFSLRKSVVASGGQTTSASYQLHSAIGQNLTAQSASTTYQITTGFYQQNRDLIFFNEFESNP